MFDTDRCIIIAYPPGASGKFLINSLCMNKEFCPQVPAQILPLLDKEETQQQYIFELLTTFIEKNPNKFSWNDLTMIDIQFFGTTNFIGEKYSQALLDFYINNLKKSLSIKHALNKSKYFFKVVHNNTQEKFYKDIWNNSKTIQIVNCETWIQKRNSNEKSVKKYPVNTQFLEIENAYKFNAESFLSLDRYIQEYINLLNYFSLAIKNIDVVKKFYNIYIPYILGYKP